MAESKTTVKHDVTVDFGGIELTGALVHDNENRVLELELDEGPEPISISLQATASHPSPGTSSSRTGLNTRA
ncbi:hypothetical protein [Streptomyces sp. MMS24-I29]|uniref:hypothetical protein n=1 Tax=Streptomyces sp. MMS24-I29 TaxID=3351480 RepID=UPI003C7A66E2